MNYGAKMARGNVLYFVHADTQPPPGYVADIQESLRMGYLLGGYRSRFDAVHPLLSLNSYFSRFNPLTCRGRRPNPVCEPVAVRSAKGI